MLFIVGVIVERDEHSRLFETLDKETLLVQIGKANRSDHPIHTMFSCPTGDGVEEFFRDLKVVDDIVSVEADGSLVLQFVHPMVNKTGDPSYRTPVGEGEEADGLYIVVSRVFLWIETPFLILDQARYVLRCVGVQIDEKGVEGVPVGPGGYFAYGDHRIASFESESYSYSLWSVVDRKSVRMY